MSDELDRFDDALREWAGRQPRRTPQQAATAVRSAIHGDRRRRSIRRSALASAAALALAVTTGLLWQPGSQRETVVAAVAETGAGLGEGVVLMWLDDETPLYMNFHSPANGAAENGATP